MAVLPLGLLRLDLWALAYTLGAQLSQRALASSLGERGLRHIQPVDALAVLYVWSSSVATGGGGGGTVGQVSGA